MDKLLACAMAYEHLLDTRYRFVIGRKGKITELEISFDSSQFHHLTGLHKLRDLRIFRGDRSKIYQQIRSGNIPFDFLKKSRYFSSIQGRLEAFPHIETFFDNDSTIFQYNPKIKTFSSIDASYLLACPHEDTVIFIFLDYAPDSEYFFCRSFFPKSDIDYTKGQAIYTLLKKEKTNKNTGISSILYNRLTPAKNRNI